VKLITGCEPWEAWAIYRAASPPPRFAFQSTDRQAIRSSVGAMTIVYVISAALRQRRARFFSRENRRRWRRVNGPCMGRKGRPFDSLTGAATPDLCCAHRIRVSSRPNWQSLAWSGSKSFGADCKNNQMISRQRCGVTPTYSKHARELGEGKIPNDRTELARYKSLLGFLEMAAGLMRRIKRLIPQRSRSWFYSARSLRSLIGSKSAHQWLVEIGTNTISVPIRIGVLCGGMGLSPAAIGALWWTCKDLPRPSGRK
jgi:hypothetical protein